MCGGARPTRSDRRRWSRCRMAQFCCRLNEPLLIRTARSVGGGQMRASLVTSLILAAAARAADVAGQYQASNIREMASGLLLKRDGHFEYFLTYGAADYWAKGTWQRLDGAVVLN